MKTYDRLPSFCPHPQKPVRRIGRAPDATDCLTGDDRSSNQGGDDRHVDDRDPHKDGHGGGIAAGHGHASAVCDPNPSGCRSEDDRLMTRTSFTPGEARSIGEQIGIDWEAAPFDVEQFRMGMDVELEHGLQDPATNVTGDDPLVTGKIALAHLNEFPDYYTRLDRMEAEAKRGN